MTATKALAHLRADINANGGGRPAIILYSGVDSNAAGVNTGLVNPRVSATGKYIYRDAGMPNELPQPIERENLQGHNSPYPDLADTLFDLTGVTVLHIQLARAGASMVAAHQADGNNPNKHFDLSTPALADASLLGPNNEIPHRDTILPLSRGLIDLCPGFNIVATVQLYIGGTWDADNAAGNAPAAAAYVDRMNLLADRIGADHVVVCKSYAEGADLATAQANADPVSGKIHAIRAAQQTFIDGRPNAVIGVDPVFDGIAINSLQTNPDGSHASGGEMLDDKHLSDDMMTACGISFAKVIAGLI